MERKSRPEIIILLALGIEPKDLIQKGYSKSTIYKYSKEVKKAKTKISEMLR